MDSGPDAVILIRSTLAASEWLRREPDAAFTIEADPVAQRPDVLAHHLMRHRRAIAHLLQQSWSKLICGDPQHGTIRIEIEAAPMPTREGHLESPTCAACGGYATGVLERHLVWNAIEVRLDGRWGGLGDATTETTDLVRDIGGLLRVKCPNEHEWSTRLLFPRGEPDPLDLSPTYDLTCTHCGVQDVYIASATVLGPIALGPKGFELGGHENLEDVIVRCRKCGHEAELDEHLVETD